MKNWLDETDDELAALTAGNSGWSTTFDGSTALSGRRSAPLAASVDANSFSGSVDLDRRATTFGSTQQSHWGGNTAEEGFQSIMPPTPGNFSAGTIGHLANPSASNFGNPLTNPLGSPLINSAIREAPNTTLQNPLGNSSTIGTSQNTAHLDPNPERLTAGGVNSSHAPYSNYESIMSNLGHFQNNMSYGQASRMNDRYADREKEMYQQFENEPFHLGNGLEFAESSLLEESILLQDDDGVNDFGGGEEELEKRQEKQVVRVNNDGALGYMDEAFPVQSRSTDLRTNIHNRHSVDNSPSCRRTMRLKEWMELHGSSLQGFSSSPEDMSTEEKLYIEKVTRLSHAILTKVMDGLKKKCNKQSNKEGTFHLDEDWEPRPSDIAVECITVTEVASNDGSGGAGGMTIEDVNFDVISNFNWENSSWTEDQGQDVGLLHAMGKLMYVLYFRGEAFPAVTNKQGNRERGESRDSDDGIIEMLRMFLDNEGNEGDGNGTEADKKIDELFVKMKSEGLPLPLCRLICDISKQSEINRNITLADLLSELNQMTEFPAAFLYGSLTSRWELLFGNNHMFGRKKELGVVMEAVSRVEKVDSKKDAILICGHAGSGKTRLVQEIRKPLKAKGWTFLRCKFEKAIQSEPLLVVAMGLDEFFMSTAPCFPNTDYFASVIGSTSIECTCSEKSCPRKIIQGLNSLIGLDGMHTLCQWMPILKNLVKESYPVHADYIDNGAEPQHPMSEQAINDLTIRLGVLLDVIASACPVLFFVDDLQWADVPTMSLLTSLISRVGSSEHAVGSNCSLLFIGACRIDEGLTKEVVLSNLQQELNTCECITLSGFDVDSLNEMMSEVLCLPKRKTLLLSKTIHEKTLGMPLYVVEMVDAILADELLNESENLGWEWDLDSIERKPISTGAAELLSRKIQYLPPEVIRVLQVLSCFEPRLECDGVDIQIIDAVTNPNPNDSTDTSVALCVAAKNSFINISGTVVAFSHTLIRKATYELIPTTDRIPLLLKLIACLVTKSQMDSPGTNAMIVLATVNLMNKIGSDYVSSNLQQSYLFAEYNLEAGKRLIEEAKFTAALEYLQTGMTYLQGSGWDSNYYLASGLTNNMAVASYALGNEKDCLVYANQVLEHATAFEDKFTAYCAYIKILASESTDRAIEKLLYILPFAGEPVDLNAITQDMAIDEIVALKRALAGNQKVLHLQATRMSDKRMLMSMKLMSLLVLYTSQQKAFASGYLAIRMIRLSLQYGQCEDTVYAMSIFCSSLCYTINDDDEAYSLAQVALTMMKNYNMNQLIPRIYGLLYGTVLSTKDSLQSTLEPLSKACHLAFSHGVHEHAVLNTLIYIKKCLDGGKRLPLLVDELASLTQKHQKLNQMPVIVHFLAPTYSTLSILSGVVLEEPNILAEYANEPTEDIIVAAVAQNEPVYVRAAVSVVIFESVILRDFAKASEIILNYSQFFEVNAALEANLFFAAGLVSFHMARLTRESHWIEKSTKMLNAYENWSKRNPSNNEHKYLLLKAEFHQLNNETEAAISAYQASIDLAHSNQFIQHEAIACEMSAHHFGNIGEKTKTREMIQKSHDVYLEWGAKAKAKSVLELLNLRYLNDTVLNSR